MYVNSTSTAPAERPTTMSDHMQAIRSDLAELTERLRNIADRVTGGTPRAVSEAQKTPAFSLHNGASEIRTVISYLRDEVNRLDDSI